MVQIARSIESSVPRDPLMPPAAFVESSFAEALDSVSCSINPDGIWTHESI